jgi:hypothetical protein
MANTPTPAPKIDNELKVTWDKKTKKLVIASKPELWKDQVVKCTNATDYQDAVLTLTFVDDSPFTSERAGAVIKQGEVRKLVKNGRFSCDCTLNYSDGRQTTSAQGGVVIIRP